MFRFRTVDGQQVPIVRDVTFTLPERRADEVVTRALDWVRRTPGKFFGWVHVFDPHSPYEPPAEFAGKSPRPYDDEVAWVDHALEPLLTHLATLSRPTTVIVTWAGWPLGWRIWARVRAATCSAERSVC